jgi:hypothetical protein
MSTILEIPSGYWAIVVAALSVAVVAVEKFGTLLTWLGVRPAKETELRALTLQNEEDHKRMRGTVDGLRVDNEASHRELRMDNDSAHREMRQDMAGISKELGEIGKGLARIEGRLEGKR